MKAQFLIGFLLIKLLKDESGSVKLLFVHLQMEYAKEMEMLQEGGQGLSDLTENLTLSQDQDESGGKAGKAKKKASSAPMKKKGGKKGKKDSDSEDEAPSWINKGNVEEEEEEEEDVVPTPGKKKTAYSNKKFTMADVRHYLKAYCGRWIIKIGVNYLNRWITKNPT
jgi:hypothetical protein